MSKDLANTTSNKPTFTDGSGFELAQRMAKALAESNIIPQAYQKSIPNCLVALEYANRVGISPLAAMQNIHIIGGKPTPSAAFIIAAINSCGRFEPLKYKMFGEGQHRGCLCWTRDKDGETLEGPAVTLEMANREGWAARKGSKWLTMPEVMLRYRAASFFGRLYAPDIMLGMHTSEEVEDSQQETRSEGGGISSAINAKLTQAQTQPEVIFEDAEIVEERPLSLNLETPVQEELAPSERVEKMLSAFAGIAITRPQIERWAGVGVEALTQHAIIRLTGIYKAIQAGAAASDYFEEVGND